MRSSRIRVVDGLDEIFSLDLVPKHLKDVKTWGELYTGATGGSFLLVDIIWVD